MEIKFEGFNITVSNPEVQEKIKKLVFSKIHRPKTKKRWTPAESDKLCELYNSGARAAEIAAQLNRTAHAVGAQIWKLQHDYAKTTKGELNLAENKSYTI